MFFLMFLKTFVWVAVSLWVGDGVGVLRYARAQPAEQEAVQTVAVPGPRADKKADFVGGIVERVANRWSKTFLPMATAQLPKDHAVNEPGRRVHIEQIVDIRGEPLRLTVAESSGSKEFDEAAVDVLRDLGAVGPPPAELQSDDDRIHVMWTMTRSGEQHEEAVVVDREGAIDVAVPWLLKRRRDAEAIRRLSAKARQGQAEVGLGIFARVWLDREAVLSDAPLGCNRDALTHVGDTRQAGVVAALIAKPDAACDDALLELAANPQLPVTLRARCVEALAAPQTPKARKLLSELEKAVAAPLRAAAIFASARPGGGRPALFRLTPFLRDKDVEVRAAAGAGLLKSVGDGAIDQLYLLFKETDPRPYERTAVELGRLSSPASADLLGRMLRKDAGRIRLAAALALQGRSDAAAKTIFERLTADPHPLIRTLAATPSAADLEAAAQAMGNGDGALATFEKLLGNTRGRPVAALWTLQQWGGATGQQRASLMRRWRDVAGGNPNGSSIATVR